MNAARRCFVVAATAVAVACGGGSPVPKGKMPITTSSPQALRAYLEGRALAETLRATDAYARYAEAVELDPDFALAWLGLAGSAPSPSEALPALDKAVALADRASEAEALLIRGIQSGVNADPEGQRRAFETLVQRYPEDERAHLQLGGYYFVRQEWLEAIPRLKRSIAIAPDYPPPYNLLGYCLRNLERFDEAEKALAKYVELIPDEPNPHDSYAELLMKVGKLHESMREYRRALDIDPNFTPSYIGLGHDQIFLGQLHEARNTFARLAYIARNDGERRQAHTWTAASYLYEGDHESALREVDERRAIAVEADDWLSLATDLNLLGVVLLDAGRPDEALEHFQEAVDKVEKAYATEELRETFRRNNLYNRARVALARGETAAAAELAEQYRARVEEHALPAEQRAVHDLLGRIAIARADWTLAVAELQQANQQNPQVLYLLARAHEAAGDLGAARELAGRAAHFNGLAFAYAFVRNKALAMVERLDSSPAPAGAAVPALPRRSLAVIFA